jgi:EmrB/QacA subfamily drug resistance transporter
MAGEYSCSHAVGSAMSEAAAAVSEAEGAGEAVAGADADIDGDAEATVPEAVGDGSGTHPARAAATASASAPHVRPCHRARRVTGMGSSVGSSLDPNQRPARTPVRDTAPAPDVAPRSRLATSPVAAHRADEQETMTDQTKGGAGAGSVGAGTPESRLSKTGTAQAGREPMSRDQRLVLTIAILASFVSFLDGTVVTVALPAIERDLGGGLTTQQWVVDAYLVTLGALILVAGSLSDVYGRILIIRIGLVGFGITSIAIAAAPTAEFLIIARALQGVAGALLVPSSLALITSNFRGPAQARAIGVWTAATTSAMIAGPLLGGLFVDLLSWRLVFVINVIPIAAAMWLLVVLHHNDTHRSAVPIDWLGAALCTLGLGGTVYALIEQPTLGWGSPQIWLPLGLGILSFAGFLVRQALARVPMMPLGLFRVRNFWTGNVATAFIYGALSLNGFVVGVYLQQGAGLPATLAGLAMLPSTILMIAFSSRVGTLAGRWGPRLFMTIGPLVMAGGALLLLTVSSDFSYWTQVLPGIVLFGTGLVITVAPLTSAILGALDPARSGIASAVNNAVSRVAGLLVIAMLGAIVGGSLDLTGFHRAAIVTAVFMVAGAVVSFAGIRNPPRSGPGTPAAGQASNP